MKDKLKEFFIKNKIAVIIAAVVLVAVIIGVIIAVVGGKDKKDGNDNTQKGTNKEYTLNVQSEGGMVFGDVNVYVYNGGVNDDLINAGRTDENGQFKFTTDAAVDGLGFAIQGLPEEGYELKEIYKVSETKGKDKDELYIYVKSVIEPLKDMDNTKFELGSIIKDFTVTTCDGAEVNISKLLEEKDAVVLNFFYIGCVPCKNEMPYLEEAYKQYSDKLAVVAMSPIDKEDDKLKEYVKELGLTFYVAQCDQKWEKMMDLMAYPTTVVIDKWGMISFIHEGTVTEAGVFEAIFGYFTASDYKQHTVKYLEDIVSASAEEGTESNPIEILPDATEFEAKVSAGKELHYEIPKVSNMILTIEDADAYVIYEDEKYEAKDGLVSLVISAPDPYTPAKFIIGNSGSSDKTFKLTLSAVKGTMMNPYELQVGEVVTEIEAGNEQGVYHTFTATENGTVTYKPITSQDDVKFDVTLYNLDTYANRTLSADANEDGTVSVVVDKGNVVQIIVATLPDENNEYPAATIKGELSFEAGEGTGIVKEDIEYVVTIKDVDGNALSGVNIVIDTAELVTDASGVAKTTLKSGSYMVAITPPDGLKVQGDVTVSADNPSVTVTLVSVNAKMVDYTVKVTDESGKAISGATVIVGNSMATTNSSGEATVNLAEGSYDVAVSANGYDTGSGSVTKSSKSVTIKLKKATVSTTGTTYTVNAVDYNGAAISGVTVIFKSGGVAKATATTDSTGKATATLAKGNYDVALVYEGYGFDSSNAKLTSSQTSVKVTMAKVATKTEDVWFDTTGAYYIEVGGQYVDIPAADSNNSDCGGNSIFLFEPTESGTYKIAVSSSSAAISYWGASTFFVSNATDSIEHTSTSITLNVKPANIGSTYVVGIKGVSNTVVSVIRTGNAVLDESDIPYTTYVATKTPTKQNLGLSLTNMTYVDITNSSSYTVVYDANGYGHLGSASGPMLYVNMNSTDRYGLSFLTMYGEDGEDSGTTALRKTFYNADGTLNKKEDYTDCMRKYILNRYSASGLYPLTKDLEYMLKNGGEGADWWSLSSSVPGLNVSNAWMFACCYLAQ